MEALKQWKQFIIKANRYG